MLFEEYRNVESWSPSFKDKINTVPDFQINLFCAEIVFEDTNKNTLQILNAFYDGKVKELDIHLLKKSAVNEIRKGGWTFIRSYIKDNILLSGDEAREAYGEMYDKLLYMSIDMIHSNEFLLNGKPMHK